MRLLISFGVFLTATAFVPQLPRASTSWSKGKILKTSIKSRSDDQCDVAVFGGGFGGLYTALALSRKARLQGQPLDIALIDPSDRFIFLPLLYDLVVGTASEAEVCPTFRELLLGTGIRHIQASFDCFATPDLYSAKLTNSKADCPESRLEFRASVVSVGATPQATIGSIPGAATYAQPFYTREDAQATKLLLERLELQVQEKLPTPRIAIVGGGYGGVELAACVKRRLPDCQVALLTNGPPMKGTRAEPLVEKALAKIGVEVEMCVVNGIQSEYVEMHHRSERRLSIDSTVNEFNISQLDGNELWDAILWTAGSGPAFPVCEELEGLAQVEGSGRLITDRTLRCSYDAPDSHRKPSVWALGDCSQIVDSTALFETPKTAQAAIQQADIAASNVLSYLDGSDQSRNFHYQDLGSMLNLGGINGAVLAPKEGSSFDPLFSTLLDTTRVGLDIADGLLSQLSSFPTPKGRFDDAVDQLGLSLGGYGLGVETNAAPGTLSGTLSGAARRAVYSIRMPTNRQRAKAAILGALSTASALSKDLSNKKNEKSEDSI